MEGFIEQINRIRKILFGVSVSAIVLAPLAIGLSIFLINHPRFFKVLENESDFGVVLSILLAAVIVISAVWLIVGIRQHLSLSSWNKRYGQYTKEKSEIDKKIAAQYGLDEN